MTRRYIILGSSILLLAGIAVAIRIATVRVRDIVIEPSATIEMTARTQNSIGTVTTGRVSGIYMGIEGNANGNRIVGVGAGSTPNDAIIYGQPIITPTTAPTPQPYIDGDIPYGYIHNYPIVTQHYTMPSYTLVAGSCDAMVQSFPGATVDMAGYLTFSKLADVNAQVLWMQNVSYAVYVPAQDTVAVRICAYANVTTDEVGVTVTLAR